MVCDLPRILISFTSTIDYKVLPSIDHNFRWHCHNFILLIAFQISTCSWFFCSFYSFQLKTPKKSNGDREHDLYCKIFNLFREIKRSGDVYCNNRVRSCDTRAETLSLTSIPSSFLTITCPH